MMRYPRWSCFLTVIGSTALMACATSQGRLGPAGQAGPGSSHPGAEIYRVSRLKLPMPQGLHSASHTETEQQAELLIQADGQSRLTVSSVITKSYVGCPTLPPNATSTQACHDNPPPPETTRQTDQLDGTATRQGEQLLIQLKHGEDPRCRMTDSSGASVPCPARTLELTCARPSAEGRLACQTNQEWPGVSAHSQRWAVKELVFERQPSSGR